MQSILKLIFALYFCGVSLPLLFAQATPPTTSSINITNQQSILDLAASAQIFSDTTGDLSITAIQNENFIPLTDFYPSLDVNIYWVKLRVKSHLKYPSDWRLSLFREWCEEVKVFSKNTLEEQDWMIQRTGYLCPLKDLDLNEEVKNMARKTPNAISISLLPNEEKVIYIRYRRQYRELLFLDLKLVPMIEAANQLIDFNRRVFFTVAVISMLFILAFYHLLIFFMTRDILYFYFALYGGSTIPTAIIQDRDISYYLFYTYPDIQPWVFNLAVIVGIIIYILFTRSYLNAKERFPKLDTLLLILLGLGIIIGFIVTINFIWTDRQYIPNIPAVDLYTYLIIIIYWVLWVNIWKDRQPGDVFYLWREAIFLLMMILAIFEKLNGYKIWDFAISAIQFGLITELLIFSMGLGYKTRQVKIEKQRFQALDKVKSRFFANLSHEFRTPLTLVMGPLKQIMSKLDNPKDQNLLRIAHRNAQRLLELINQLLDLSKLEAGKMELTVREQNFVPLLKGIVMSFESLAARKNIRLHFVSKLANISLYVDKDKIEKIFYNLLSNAFKFTEEGGEVTILITQQKKYIEVLLRDTGIGIPKARLANIFNRFFQVDSSEIREQEGTGIGLALVKELIQLHGGSVEVKSKVNKGTTFTIFLPRGKKHFTEKEIYEEIPLSKTKKVVPFEFIPNYLYTTTSKKELKVENGKIPDTTVSDNLPVVLLIEDNVDVRTYIKQHLEGSFQILEAVNGQEGIDKALNMLPDLIISDVMMPKKGGYEVCRTLKTDQRTSHIPIILLTAKAAQEEKLKGLETGADNYLIKPFDTQELEVRVRNLIELRRQLRLRFSQAPTIEPQAIQTSEVDKAFLEKICTTIKAQLSNEQFSVEILAQAANMSSVHLNRKLKALTDQTTNKFIQAMRLQQAMLLLQQKKGNVSEIAFETGFSSTAYFVKCFREKHGQTPGSFLKRG